MPCLAVDWTSRPFYFSIAFSAFSVFGTRPFFEQLRPRTPVLKLTFFLAIALANEIASGALFVAALRDQPVFDHGFVLTYALPVLVVLLTLPVCVAAALLLLEAFPSAEACRQFLPAIVCGNLLELAYALAYGSAAGFLLFAVGVAENAAKLALIGWGMGPDSKLD
jgi:hypothetical protein